MADYIKMHEPRSMYQGKYGDLNLKYPDFSRDRFIFGKHTYKIKDERLYLACKNCDVSKSIYFYPWITKDTLCEWDHGDIEPYITLKHFYKKDAANKWYVWRITMRSTDG